MLAALEALPDHWTPSVLFDLDHFRCTSRCGGYGRLVGRLCRRLRCGRIETFRTQRSENEVNIPLADQFDHSSREMDTSTKLAFERTRLAHDNTMMSWIRTSTSLITFGFSIYKFFQLDLSAKTVQRALIGPREFALALIVVGLLSLLMGAMQNYRDLQSLRKEYPSMRRSLSVLVAALVATLGLAALVAVIFRS